MVNHIYLSAVQIRDQVVHCCLPQGEAVLESSPIATLQRGRDLDWVPQGKHESWLIAQMVEPEPQGEAEAGVFPDPVP